ncbi:hypothetical protein GBAR_LOCUS16231, partial [Geodia barretti]
MPPEAIAPAASSSEKSKYDASIDIFSFGVITIFTVGETFPSDPLAPNYLDKQSGHLVARTELQRRSQYMSEVNSQLGACGQLRGDHPLIRVIQQCLKNDPRKRPSIREVLCLLEEARAGAGDYGWERMQALLSQSKQHDLEQDVESLVQKLQLELQSKSQENAELQRQLQSSEMEGQRVKQQLERELARAEETIRRNQQTIQKETEPARKDRELAEALEKLRHKVSQWPRKTVCCKVVVDSLLCHCYVIVMSCII